MTRLSEVAARSRLNTNMVPQSFRLIRKVSLNSTPNIPRVSEAIPQREASTSKEEKPEANKDIVKKGANPNVEEEAAAYM